MIGLPMRLAAPPPERRRLTRRRCAVLAGTSLALVAAIVWHGPALGLFPPLLLENTGRSMPVGLYVYDHAPPARHGEIVVLPHPPQFRGPWLMKRVEGVPGDLYCWDPALGTHVLAGRLMPPPSGLARSLGVQVWTGCRRLEASEIVGYGEGASYDSRHIGPVPEADLWGVYRPLAVQ
jgi:type IV secretory pathway protease TraF